MKDEFELALEHLLNIELVEKIEVDGKIKYRLSEKGTQVAKDLAENESIKIESEIENER